MHFSYEPGTVMRMMISLSTEYPALFSDLSEKLESILDAIVQAGRSIQELPAWEKVA